jgi:hypothetical protein
MKTRLLLLCRLTVALVLILALSGFRTATSSSTQTRFTNGFSSFTSSTGEISLSPVTGRFFTNPTNDGAFTATPNATEVFRQTFPLIDFNPPSGTIPCSNATGVDVMTRPFTAVVPLADGSCQTIVAEGNGQQAGVGDLAGFQAVFQGSFTVSAQSQVTFQLYSDDGWILSIGPSAEGAQPTYVSGPLVNSPSAGPFTGFSVVGAFNTDTAPVLKDLVVDFPAEGTYPFELDYAEGNYGRLTLVLGANRQLLSGSSSGSGLPGKVTLIAPSGTINSSQPTYTWNADSAATRYYLSIEGPSGQVHAEWYEASVICSGGICSVAPSVVLGGGNYTWMVQTGNDTGLGPWSDSLTFSVSTASLPGKATLISPNGSIGNNNPTYIWDEVSGATWYYLWVDGPTDHVFDQWYSSAQANCNGTTCSVPGPTPNLGTGTHTWWIQTWNDVGYGPWSDGMSFTPAAPALPGKATLNFPNGSIGNNNPTYDWDEVADATYYLLWVDGPTDHVFHQWYTSAEANCNGSTCSVEGVTPNLVAGGYTWWIQTWNSAGYGPWSDGMNFSVPLPNPATLISPSGSIGNNNPTYTWNEVPGVTWYLLWVDGSADHLFHKWYSSTEANCNGTTCSVPNATPNMSAGTYNWWVRTWSSAGYGPWSDGLNFTVSP